jgi:hypothetical protein
VCFFAWYTGTINELEVPKSTYRNLSWPAVSQICNLIFLPITSTMRVPNSTPIVCGESGMTGREHTEMQRGERKSAVPPTHSHTHPHKSKGKKKCGLADRKEAEESSPCGVLRERERERDAEKKLKSLTCKHAIGSRPHSLPHTENNKHSNNTQENEKQNSKRTFSFGKVVQEARLANAHVTYNKHKHENTNTRANHANRVSDTNHRNEKESQARV